MAIVYKHMAKFKFSMTRSQMNTKEKNLCVYSIIIHITSNIKKTLQLYLGENNEKIKLTVITKIIDENDFLN